VTIGDVLAVERYPFTDYFYDPPRAFLVKHLVMGYSNYGFSEEDILRPVRLIFHPPPVTAAPAGTEPNASWRLQSSPSVQDAAKQIPGRIHVHRARLAVGNAQQNRILLVLDPLKPVRFFESQSLCGAFRLNEKEGASLKKIRALVVARDQATHEIDADIFLPWDRGGESNSCQQMFNKELGAITETKGS
jgi:hypothetical protein